MVKKLKFKPKITRVKLNPEQAVLECYCYSSGYPMTDGIGYNNVTVCYGGGRATLSEPSGDSGATSS